MKTSIKILAITVLALIISACSREADVASYNLSRAADQFEIDRRIVFYNGITNEYMLTIEGRCSIKDEGSQLEVTCKTGQDEYKKHFLGLSDNVTYFAEQLGVANVSGYRYRVMFRPETLIPNIDLDISAE